jgi:DNA ligase-1
VFGEIEGTTKRLEITDILRAFFLRVIRQCPEDLPRIIHLSLSRLGPVYEGLELGLGEQLLIKAVAQSTGRKAALIKAEIEARGDIGLVAETSRSNQTTMMKPKPLDMCKLFKALLEIATASGAAATTKKLERVQGLFVACSGTEAKYLFRLLEGKLRIGLAEQTLLAALGQAAAELHRQEDQCDPIAVIKSVYNSMPNYNAIIPELIRSGIVDLPKICRLTPGIPLKPMLAFPTKSIGEVLDRFEGLPFTCEYKYDGERAQIHRLPSGQVCVYSRNSENMSGKYPDLAEKLPQILEPSTHSYVIDCEVVAWDREANRLLPFQILSTRKRKDVTAENIHVQVCLFAFDILFLNGEAMLERTLAERRAALRSAFHEVEGEFYFAKHLDGSSVDDIQGFLEESIAAGCEGLMVKTLEAESSYEPSRRSRKWLKIKKDYLDGCGDSLDLVVIGGYLGRGKRKGGYGGYLLACYDPENEEYQAICKIGTGFSESDLEAQWAYFKDHVIPGPRSYYRCTDATRPDVWFAPVQVWEVKAADFSISPVYTAAWGWVEAGKGISLRFPRYLRVRDDKKPDEATTSQQVSEMYRQQALASGANAADDIDDYY